MVCRMFGAKAIAWTTSGLFQLDSWEHISVKFESEFYH